ncbi:MAG TPA: hypothetical protein VIL97_05810 [Thermoanaerobaculia bacterium]
MKSRRPVSLATLIFILILPASLFAAAAPQQRPREAVRAELAAYFRDIAQNSPRVLGGLAGSPETMTAIQQRIASMSDEELAKFEKLLADTPDWKVAPEAIASAFPPEVLAQVKKVGADYTDQLPKGDKMREDVQTLLGVLKLLPDAKLLDLGIDRKMIATLEETFTEMTPLQAAMLQKRAADTSSWREQSALAIHALPPALQRGAAALAAHGPLSREDLLALLKFRNELIALLERVDKLPPELRDKLNVDQLSTQLAQLRTARPDVLFMMRHNMPPEMIEGLKANVAFLERISRFSDAEKEGLEEFRGELAEAFHSVKAKGAADDWSELDSMVGALSPQELFFMQQRMASFGAWQVALPAAYQALAEPETQQRLRALQGSPDPVAVRSLEAFRQESLRYIDSVAGTEGLDPQFVARARRTIETASLDRLEIIRSTAAGLGPDATPIQLLSIVAMHEINWNCSLNFVAVPEVCVPAGCVEICDPTGILGCAEVCTPEVCTPEVRVDVSFDQICNPLEDAIEVVEHSITGAANTVIEAMRAGVQASLDAVQTTVNNAIISVTSVIDTTISAITSTVTDIYAFVQTIPDLAWDAIQAALNLLLDIEIRNGITVRDLVAEGAQHAMESMNTLLGLAGDWWTAISTFTLPAIPCPPTGFHTPFGNVGDGAATDNYGRYKLVIDGIIGMIPDTETSLAIKIPAQVLYMGFDFLGLCLEQASAAADAAELTTRHDLVLAGFNNLQSYIGTQVGGLSTQTGSQTDTLVALIESEATENRSTITTQSAAIQSLLDNENADIQSLVNAESDSIQALLESETDSTQSAISAFRDLNLRLTIERVLRGGVGSEVGHLQLRAPWGHLELVKTIVRESIDAMITAQETIGQAESFFAQGIALMNAGKDKLAFTQFAMAYREAAK